MDRDNTSIRRDFIGGSIGGWGLNGVFSESRHDRLEVVETLFVSEVELGGIKDQISHLFPFVGTVSLLVLDDGDALLEATATEPEFAVEGLVGGEVFAEERGGIELVACAGVEVCSIKVCTHTVLLERVGEEEIVRAMEERKRESDAHR